MYSAMAEGLIELDSQSAFYSRKFVCKKRDRSQYQTMCRSPVANAVFFCVVLFLPFSVLGQAPTNSTTEVGSDQKTVEPVDKSDTAQSTERAQQDEGRGSPIHNITNCDIVKFTYSGKGFNGRDIPKDPLEGGSVQVCTPGLTCCTEQMEYQLSAHSRREFDHSLKDHVNRLGLLLRKRATRFDEYFKKLLETSRHDFHEMFRRTYGVLYEQNSGVFTDLFTELERYYDRGRVDLQEVLDNFFMTLYQKMFTVLNSQYRFDDRYLGCVSEHMKELKPFGDVPTKLAIQVKRSFIATRTFAQALGIGSDVANKMTGVNPSPDCGRALMKMTHCPACKGLPDVKPCEDYCLNVMKGCLAYHAELDQEWNNYVDALIDVADRLVSSFNIEIVVDPIHIKISEAIMNFQENGFEVTQRVFNGCGKPRLGARDSPELYFETLKFNPPGNRNGGTTLEKLVSDIKRKVKVTKKFWINLPYHMCNDEDKSSSIKERKDNCWNGNAKARYEPKIAGHGMTAQSSNPEVHVDTNRPNSLLNEQIFNLRLITNKLRNAYQGLDVDWVDLDDWSDGSGSGSGYGPAVDGSGGGSDIDFGEPREIAPVNVTSRPAVERPPSTTTGGQPGTTVRSTVSVTRAVATYLIPIVVMWFGSLFYE